MSYWDIAIGKWIADFLPLAVCFGIALLVTIIIIIVVILKNMGKEEEES